MTVPEDFKLDPVHPGSFPEPQPPRVRKSDIYRDSEFFKNIDDHAVAEARISYDNFRDLMWNLVFKNNYGELEKARAIFRWLTSKDLKSICLKGEVPELPERILNDFGSGRGSYARAFEFMARYSGLYAVSIKGWAKGIDYSLGSDVTSDPVNHSWNAVYVNGNWHLLDCSWASLRSRAEDAPSSGFDDFYFLTEPAEMIYSHFPENSAWQLLAAAQSNLDYEKHPHVKSHFFTLGLRLLEQNSGVLHAQNGVLTLTLGFTRQTAFTYKVTYGDDNVEQVRDVRLSRYLIQEMTKNRLTYYFRAPVAGTYRLTIFARDARDGIPKGNIVFRSVAEYKVVCPEVVHDFEPFPYCSDSSWGSDVYTQQYPIIPSIKTAILITSTGKAEVAFVKDEKLKLYARLVRDGLSFEELKSWLSFEDGKNQTVLRIDLKIPGEYGLEIFANDPESDGEIYTHFSQYLIVSSGQEFSSIFGSVFDRDDLPAQEALKVHKAHGEPKSESSDAVNGEITATTKVSDEDDVRRKLYASVVTAEAPSGFEAAPVSDKDFAAKRPSESYRPVKLFDDVAIFKAVDGHSVEVSKVEHGNFRDLIWHLIYARNITDELEKARAIFVYLASKDLSKINFGRVERDSPEEMLMNLKDGRTTYARVYETLCSYAGLNCDTVTGFAKGADYRPDMHFSGDEGQHSWNAVFVNGTWQLVDCHWAARRLVGKQVAGDNVRYELDNYYFMPASGQLIFTHYPLVGIWQLLESPVTLEEFENLVPIKSAFFKYGLSVVSHRNAIIHVEEGEEVTIVIGCTKGSNLAFTFNLAHYEIGEDYRGVPLNQFAMNYQSEGNSYFRVRLPEGGSYQLVIYAKETTPSHDAGGMFSGVCEYEIIFGNSQSKALPFPPCAHNTWGPGDSYYDYSVTPLQKGVIVETVNGTAEVQISMKDELRFTAKLKSALVDDDTQLTPFLIQRLVGNVAVFSIRAPLAGEFGLEIYANNPLVDGQSLHHVYQYLIICNEPFTGDPFPSLPPSYLGPQPQFKPLGLAVAGSSPDPLIVVEGGELHLSFATTQPTRMSCQLIFCSDGGDRDYSEYSLQQSDGAAITYLIKLPQPGFYKAQFFALPASDASESLPGVYNSLIDCRSTFVSSAPFPKQYGIWRDGCYLYEPLDGHLQPNRPSKGGASTYQHVFFSVDVPRATSVAVVVGEDWFPLDQKPDSISWSGEVHMDAFWGRERKLSVVTSFDDPPSRYGTLLEYSM